MGRHSKILIIEDDEGVAAAVRAILESESFEVETLSDGARSVEEMLRVRPDLILVDLLLSGKDGKQVIKAIKQRQALRKIPIIMLSAHPAALEQAKEAGADDFIAKPFDMYELLRRVRALI